MPREDDEREWCPYCNEHHYGTSVEAVQDFIQNICKPDQ